MASSRSSDLGWTTVWSSTASPTTTTLPISGWLSAIQYAKIRATLELRGRMGNLEVQFGDRTADVVTSPDAAVGVGSFLAADGVAAPTAWTDLSAVTPGKQYIRFVLLTRNTSGTATNLGRVSAVVDAVGF